MTNLLVCIFNVGFNFKYRSDRQTKGLQSTIEGATETVIIFFDENDRGKIEHRLTTFDHVFYHRMFER